MSSEKQPAAHIDALSNLRNQASFHHDLDRAVARAHRRDDPLTVVYADVQNFKLINTAHGQAAGDWLIAATAGVVKSNIRSRQDAAYQRATYRIGGDEMAIIASTEGFAKWTMVGRLRERFNQFVDDPDNAFKADMPTGVNLRELGIGITLGAASLRGGMTSHDLKQAVEASLYRDKHEQFERRMAAFEPAARTDIDQAVASLAGYGLSRGDMAMLYSQHIDATWQQP